jgi:hypothetical protein
MSGVGWFRSVSPGPADGVRLHGTPVDCSAGPAPRHFICAFLRRSVASLEMSQYGDHQALDLSVIG